jgi:hypothetical protein
MPEQRESYEEVLGRLNRRLRTLHECARTLFQAESEQELLQSICEILVAGGELCVSSLAQSNFLGSFWFKRDTEDIPRPPGQCATRGRGIRWPSASLTRNQSLGEVWVNERS